MAKEYIRYRLTKHTRCKQVETSKSYAIRWRKEIHFLPKSKCNIFYIDKAGPIKWVLEVPVWLIEKNEKLEEILILIQQENEYRYKEIDNS